MKNDLKIVIVAACLSCICLVIEIVAVDELQRNSAEYIVDIQKNRTEGFDGFFVVVSKGSMYIASLIGFALLAGQYCAVGTQCVLVTYLSMWLGNVMKIIIAHPRPFWVDSEIYPLSCPKDFGAPSGHAITVGSVIIFFYFLSYKTQKIVSTIVCSLLLALLALDRNYLGVHFYFQVVLGFAFAFCIVSAFKCEEIWNVAEKCFSVKKFLFAFQAGVLGLNLVGIFIACFREVDLSEKWVENFYDGCNGKLTGEASRMGPASESTAVCILAGMAQGVYLRGVLLRGSICLEGWKFRGAGVSILAVGVVIEQVCEIYIKTLSTIPKLFLLSLIRYITGFYISFLIPKLLSFCVRQEILKPNN